MPELTERQQQTIVYIKNKAKLREPNINNYSN